MQVERLHEALKEFGLEEAEARLYYVMSTLGPSRAADLAEAAQIHRTEVYRLGEGLLKKGFADKTLERPARFVPLPLAEVIEERANEEQQRVATMRQRGELLVSQWPGRARAWGAGKSRFSVHQGMPQIRSLIERMISNAKQEIMVVSPWSGIARLGADSIMGPLVQQARKGVGVRVLTRLDKGNISELRTMAAHCDVRHVDLSGYHQMVIVDGREVALFVAVGHRDGIVGRHETVLWLNAPDFVLAQKALIERIWPTGIRHQVASAAFAHGRPVPKVELVRGRLIVASLMKQMLYDAHRVHVRTSQAEWRAWSEAGVMGAVTQRRDAGASICVDTDASDAALSLLTTVRGETLLVRGAADDEEVWALHTTFPDVADALQDLMRRDGDPRQADEPTVDMADALHERAHPHVPDHAVPDPGLFHGLPRSMMAIDRGNDPLE